MADATDNALAQANAQMASVREMVAALDVDYDRLEELRYEREALKVEVNLLYGTEEQDEYSEAVRLLAEWDEENSEELAALTSLAGECESEDDARERIIQDALCTEVRSEWHNPHNESEGPTDFRIVLCTGGPHVQIRGELSQGEPSRAWLEYSDWGTGMTERVNQDGDQDALLTYARQFYFGE